MTPWTVACRAPLSMGFSRQEYWSGLPCPPPGHLPNPGTEPRSPALQADSLLSEPLGKPYLYIVSQFLYIIVYFEVALITERHTLAGARWEEFK